MSFKRKARVIEFPPDHDLHGLVIHARRPNLQAIEAIYAIDPTQSSLSEQVKPILEKVFGPALISWNYHDEEDQPVPATVEGLRTIDIEALMAVFHGWVADVTAVPDGLGKESGSGPSSPGRLLDGAPTVNPSLSAALMNLPTHSVSSASSSGSTATP